MTLLTRMRARYTAATQYEALIDELLENWENLTEVERDIESDRLNTKFLELCSLATSGQCVSTDLQLLEHVDAEAVTMTEG